VRSRTRLSLSQMRSDGSGDVQAVTNQSRGQVVSGNRSWAPCVICWCYDKITALLAPGFLKSHEVFPAGNAEDS
jgi:hypothetical protein